MGLDGRKIDIRITASSEEKARQLFSAIGTTLIQAIRIDLDSEWSRNDDSDPDPDILF